MMKKWLALLLTCGLLLPTLACSRPDNKDTAAAPMIKNAANVSKSYDVVVVGGEPEGIAAAISAARNGQKTLLLCDSADLGGLYTDGELNFIDVPETRDGKVLVEGIYKEFFDAVGGSAFDINKAKQVFYDMVKAEDKLTLRVNAHFQKPLMDGNTITGVQVKEDGKLVDYQGKMTVDATADANVAAAAGVPYTYAGEDIGEKDRHMGVTLVFGLKGLDWDKITRHLTAARAKGEVTGGATDMGAKGNTAWGYTREGYAYEPKDKAMRLRGFNMSRQNDGTVLFNALIIFDVDPLDPESKKEGIRRGQAELEHIMPYLREHCVGFEKAELAHTAKSLYIRESRHMEAETMLTIDDVLENRNPKDSICVTNYPVDVQPTKTQRYGTVIGFPDQYGISLGSLVPKKVDQLFVVGRAAGFRSLAASSARIVPTGMACAQAVGVAAAVANEQHIMPRALLGKDTLIKEIQQTLKKQGAQLTHAQTEEAVMKHWAYDGVKVIRSLGFLDGGYKNDYRLDESISQGRYQNMLNFTLKKAGFPQNPPIAVNENVPVRQVVGTMARVIGDRQGVKYENNFTVYRQALLDAGIMTPDLEKYFTEPEATPQAAECVMLTANLYHWLMKDPEAVHLIAVD